MGGILSKEQEIFLRQHFLEYSDSELGEKLHISQTAAAKERRRLGLLRPRGAKPQQKTIRDDKSRKTVSYAKQQFLRENYLRYSDKELSERLGLGLAQLRTLRRKLGLKRTRSALFRGRATWTEEEERYVEEWWGLVSVKAIAGRLNRSEDAIVVRAQRLGLGSFLECGDYISLNQLFRAMEGKQGGEVSYSYKLTSWAKMRGLPIHMKKVRDCSVRVIYLDEFWAWAERNRSFVDFSKIPPLTFGEEPDWVPEQRKKDVKRALSISDAPWSSEDDNRLIALLRQHKYGYAELSKILHRTTGAIQRRCITLGIPDRPVKAEVSKWTPDTLSVLAEEIRNGSSYTEIADVLGRSSKAVQGKVYSTYFTENLDKVRLMIGDGPWGAGAPSPTVLQAKNLSAHQKALKEAITKLTKALSKYAIQKQCFENARAASHKKSESEGESLTA